MWDRSGVMGNHNCSFSLRDNNATWAKTNSECLVLRTKDPGIYRVIKRTIALVMGPAMVFIAAADRKQLTSGPNSTVKNCKVGNRQESFRKNSRSTGTSHYT
jgi:hypothetical protein